MELTGIRLFGGRAVSLATCREEEEALISISVESDVRSGLEPQHCPLNVQSIPASCMIPFLSYPLPGMESSWLMRISPPS